MAKVKNFKTIFPAVSVPLNDDYTINEPEFRAYLRWIKSFYDKGFQGLVCNGHTGEITGLSRAERKRVTQICAEECGDIMTIISGVNCENTIESIEMAREAKEAGADGILLMPPHMWLRFGMHHDAPFQYIKDVAEGADIDNIIHLGKDAVYTSHMNCRALNQVRVAQNHRPLQCLIPSLFIKPQQLLGIQVFNCILCIAVTSAGCCLTHRATAFRDAVSMAIFPIA